MNAKVLVATSSALGSHHGRVCHIKDTSLEEISLERLPFAPTPTKHGPIFNPSWLQIQSFDLCGGSDCLCFELLCLRQYLLEGFEVLESDYIQREKLKS